MILLISNICTLILVALALLVIASIATKIFLGKGYWLIFVILYLLLLGVAMPQVYMLLF